MRKIIKDYLDDVLVLVGCGCILYGLSIWSSVLTWIGAGAMLIIFGVMVGKAGS